jgi:hypothetical protein
MDSKSEVISNFDIHKIIHRRQEGGMLLKET